MSDDDDSNDIFARYMAERIMKDDGPGVTRFVQLLRAWQESGKERKLRDLRVDKTRLCLMEQVMTRSLSLDGPTDKITQRVQASTLRERIVIAMRWVEYMRSKGGYLPPNHTNFDCICKFGEETVRLIKQQVTTQYNV